MTRRWLGSLAEIADAIRRFPEAALASIAATYFALVIVNRFYWIPEAAGDLWRYYGSALAFGSFAVGAAILSEAKDLSWPARLAVSAAGLAVIVGLLLYPDVFDTLPPLLGLVIAMFLTLAPFFQRATENDRFWAYNHDLWLAAATGLVAAALIGGGASAIAETLKLLFGVPLSPRLHAQIWAIACTVIAPLTWVSLIPKHTEAFDSTIERRGTYRAVAFLGRFIMVPLLLVYAAILYVYGAKIAVDGVLPRGQIGWMVVIFGAIGTLTAHIVYPLRASGGMLVTFFWRYCFLIVLGPTVLLFLALRTRAEQYGLTEVRYLVFEFGAWLVLLALLIGTRGAEQRDLRLVPATLGLLALFAVAGPWGAAGFTTRQLVSEFRTTLENGGALEGGKLARPPRGTLSPQDRARLASIAQYLNSRERLGRLAPLMANDAEVAKSGVLTPASSVDRYRRLTKFLEYAGLTYTPGSVPPPPRYVNFYARGGEAAVLTGRPQLAGPFVLSSRADDSTKRAKLDGKDVLTLTLQNERLVVKHIDGRTVAFAAIGLLSKVASRDGQAPASSSGDDALRYEAKDGAFTVALVVTGLTAVESKEMPEGMALTNVTCWVAWSE